MKRKIGRTSMRYLSVFGAKQRDSSEQMTRLILGGSFVITILLTMLLCYSFLILGHHYVQTRIYIGIGILFYLIIVAMQVYKGRTHLAAWMLIAFYTSIGISILHIWGINAPVGILVLGFVIFLTSVMLGSKYIISVTMCIIVLLTLLQFLNIAGLSTPDRSMLDNKSTYGDVASYSVIFCIFALIAWLSGMKMERTLSRAINAELELQKERDVLALRVKAQTRSLEDAQQKELKQLYKFAELGQLTAIILHDLANYLTILTLDIEDIKERNKNSVAINHAKESIFYIDAIIDQVRNQIKNSDNSRKFDALVTTKDSIKQLRKKLRSVNLKLYVEVNKSSDYAVYGDPLRLFQAISILITNAVQANTSNKTEIIVDASATKSSVTISVKDFGKGIPENNRKTLFEPQKSTKKSGLGIGLYITKQIIETHFKGRIWLSPSMEYTQFNIQIPRIVKTSSFQNAPTLPTPHKSAASNLKQQ